MGDQPSLSYSGKRLPGPLNTRGTIKELWVEVDRIKKDALEDILHLAIGEVIDISSDGVAESTDILPTQSNISLRNAVYKVNKFDGNVIDKVYFNGSLSMQDPPIIGSLVLFHMVGNNYYIIKTLTTKRRILSTETDDNTDEHNPEFIDIDRDIQPGQVRIMEAQEGASIFLGNGNIRLATPSQTNYIALMNDGGQIGMVSNDIVGLFDDSINLSTVNPDSTILLEKATGSPILDASLLVDDASQILLQSFYNSIKLNTDRIQILKRVAPNSDVTIDEAGKILLRSNVTVDPETEAPIDGTELSKVVLDETGVALTNSSKFTMSLDLNQILMAGLNSLMKQDVLGNVDIEGLKTAIAATTDVSLTGTTVTVTGSTITLSGSLNLAGAPGASPLVTAAGPLTLTAPTISFNFGTRPVARVGDTVAGTIIGLATDPISGPIPVAGTFIGTITGPGNPTVLA